MIIDKFSYKFVEPVIMNNELQCNSSKIIMSGELMSRTYLCFIDL